MAAYLLRGFRDGGRGARISRVQFLALGGMEVHRTMDRLELGAEIGQGLVPLGRPLRLGLSAIVEDAAGTLSYWALRHPPGKPDFHHTDAFALQMRNP